MHCKVMRTIRVSRIGPSPARDAEAIAYLPGA